MCLSPSRVCLPPCCIKFQVSLICQISFQNFIDASGSALEDFFLAILGIFYLDFGDREERHGLFKLPCLPVSSSNYFLEGRMGCLKRWWVLNHWRCSRKEWTITEEEYWQASCLTLELGVSVTQSWASVVLYDGGERALCPWKALLHESQKTGVYVAQFPHLDRLIHKTLFDLASITSGPAHHKPPTYPWIQLYKISSSFSTVSWHFMPQCLHTCCSHLGYSSHCCVKTTTTNPSNT